MRRRKSYLLSAFGHSLAMSCSKPTLRPLSAFAIRAAIATLDQAAGWLPNYASAAHRDARAPVNLTPIAGLEKMLRRNYGDARLALRAVRDAIVQLNSVTEGAAT